jgi:hypothetical protein
MRPGLVLAILLFCHGTAFAQQHSSATNTAAPAFKSEPSSGPTNSHTLRRLELATGIALTAASVPVGLLVAYFSGPPMLECLDLWGDTDPEEQDACERDHAAAQHQAAMTGVWTGLAIGAVGLPLLIHGAIRSRRANVEHRRILARPTAWSVQSSPQRTTANLKWMF